MKVSVAVLSLFSIIPAIITAAPTQGESNMKNMSINPRGRLEYIVYYCKREDFRDCNQVDLSPGECWYVGQEFNDRMLSYAVGGGKCCAFYDNWNCRGIMFKATGMREKSLPGWLRGRVSSIKCERSCHQL
ncbi:hypothetical protein FPQ18DRAFT_405614 [Pyronema domesticum]|uniref:Uncharacterized protein n=1 Tax=Pyronema omphalodes (strain CBS 100304) TaxID=1076935 RepID=U4LLF5_PYROM|nr:hypothetical protein FPQ18DRAFT_405614 [Pyronema domesticum]CCX30190.1 Protein of unknown function [Pyronema omphalodes CBS 100304]